MEKKATSNVVSLMQRLDKSLGNRGSKNQGGKNFKEINEARQKATLKLKEGKNQLAFLTLPGKEDPFVEWGYHQGLQEVAFYSIPCDAFNKNETCIVCNVVDSLKKEDFTGNRHIWAPIEQKIEHYAPVINMESPETIAEGAKWVRLSKSVMLTIVDWLRNLEPDEVPFYDIEEPQKIIITYNKEEAPARQYSLDKKNMRAFTAQQIADWVGTIQPIGTYIFSKREEEVKKLVDEYFTRIENTVAESLAKGGTDTSTSVETTKEEQVSKEIKAGGKDKLDRLKSGKS